MSTLSMIWQTVVAEFSDVRDLREATIIMVRLLVATVLGAAIGYEREKRGKDAGLRTHMLVALGAAVFVLVPATMGMNPDAISRVMQGLVTGVGFLGAGVILKHEHEHAVRGLTTAASLWMAAAVGFSAGLGREGTAVAATLITLFVLVVIAKWQKPHRHG